MTEDKYDPFEENYNVSLEQELKMGHRMYQSGEIFFNNMDLPSSQFNGQKILCLDVYRGPEIVAFAHYKPSKITVTENLDLIDDKKDKEMSKRILSTLTAQYSAELIEKSADSALQQLKTNPADIALITHLGMFPDRINEEYIAKVTSLALPLLKPQGLLLFTIQEPDEKHILDAVNSHIKTLPTVERTLVEAVEPIPGGGVYLADLGTYALLVQKE